MTRSLSGCIACTLALAACGDSATDPPAPTAVTVVVTPASSALNALGATVRLSAAALDQNGDTLAQAITWSSRADTVATVDASGLVTARGEGTATITAASGGASGNAMVTVATTAPTITAVVPALWVEGGSATLSGTAFASQPGGNVVRVGGAIATVTSSTATSLAIRVPVLCGPAVRSVEVTVTASGLASDPVDHPVGPGPALAVSDGAQTVLSGGGEVCLQLPEQPGAHDYLVGVQSLSENAQLVTPVRLRSAIEPGAAARPPLARARAASAPAPFVADPLADPRTRALVEHRREEAAFMAGEVELVERTRSGRVPPAAASGSAAAVPDLDVGQQTTLKVRDFNGPQTCTQAADVSVTVRAKTAHSVFFTDDANPPGGFSQAEVQAIATDFENDVYAPHVAMFGPPRDRDGNGRVAVVITKEINKTNGEDGQIQGFVSGCDFFAKSVAPDSNEGETFYVVAPDPTGTHGQTVTKQGVIEIFPFLIAHELTHITQFGVRIAANAPLPEVFHLEGQATFAEEIVGHAVEGNQAGQNYGADVAWDFAQVASTRWYVGAFADHLWWFGGRFNTDPQDTQVPGAPEQCTWLEDVDDPCVSRASYYGMAWSFLRWAADRFFPGQEASFQQALIQSNRTGFALFEEVIGRPRQDLFPPWSAALYLDDRAAVDPELTFESWNLLDVFESGQIVPTGRLKPRVRGFSAYQDDAQVRAGSTAYWRISGPDQPGTAVKVRTTDDEPLPSHMVVWVVKIPD